MYFKCSPSLEFKLSVLPLPSQDLLSEKEGEVKLFMQESSNKVKEQITATGDLPDRQSAKLLIFLSFLMKKNEIILGD